MASSCQPRHQIFKPRGPSASAPRPVLEGSMGISREGLGKTDLVAICFGWQGMGQYWSSKLAGVWGEGEVRGVVYKIQSGSGKVYVGSTTEVNLQRRLRLHEAAWRSWERGKSGYCSVFEVLEDGEYEIELLEEVRSSNRKDLRAREGYYFRLFGPAVVNLRSPFRQPWHKKAQHRDAMRAYQRRNQTKTQERVRESNSTHIKCEACSVYVSRGYRSQHERTHKHQNNLVLNQN